MGRFEQGVFDVFGVGVGGGVVAVGGVGGRFDDFVGDRVGEV